MKITLCLFLLVSIGFGQTPAKVPLDYPTLQKLSLEELDLKTQAHKAIWGLDKIERGDLSQDTGELVFSFSDGSEAVCPFQFIGSYNTEDHTWLWAWANSSLDEELQLDARKVRKYGEEQKIERLTKSKWVGTEKDAWAMTALAVKLCSEQGAYRIPSGATHFFLAFGEVKIRKKQKQ